MNDPRGNVVDLRVPPYSRDAEESLLGGLFMDSALLCETRVMVHAEDFYRSAHGKIFDAMCSLADRGEPVDRVSVKNELVRAGAMKDAGGEEFVDLLEKTTPASGNVEYYAKIVASKALWRNLIQTLNTLQQLGYEQRGDAREFADECERRIFEICKNERSLDEAVPMKRLVAMVFADIEERARHENALTGAPSGLDALDEITNGFQPGDLVVIAARPSHGKTSLVLDTLRAVGSTGLGSTVIFEMEMPQKQLVERLLSSDSRVNSKRLRTGGVVTSDWDRLASAASRIVDMGIEIHDRPRTVLEIRALARRRAAKMAGTKTPLRLVAVDYLQRMHGTSNERNRDEQLSRMSRDLKSLAIELGVPVLLVSSMNRDIEKRAGNRRPQMSDLRECGALEFDADVIVFVNRDENNDTPSGTAELIVGKNRNGPLGDAKVAFVKEYSSFQNLGEMPGVEQKPLPLREEPPPPTERYP